MAIDTSAHTGIVIGHTARIFAERRTNYSALSSKVIQSYLGSYVQIWLGDKLAFVQCPVSAACVILHDKRLPILDEVNEVVRIAQEMYPVGTELEVLRKAPVPHPGGKGEPYYEVKNKPVINDNRSRKQKYGKNRDRRQDQVRPQPVTAVAPELPTEEDWTPEEHKLGQEIMNGVAGIPVEG